MARAEVFQVQPHIVDHDRDARPPGNMGRRKLLARRRGRKCGCYLRQGFFITHRGRFRGRRFFRRGRLDLHADLGQRVFGSGRKRDPSSTHRDQQPEKPVQPQFFARFFHDFFIE